jgi:hypothetical protein
MSTYFITITRNNKQFIKFAKQIHNVLKNILLKADEFFFIHKIIGNQQCSQNINN